MTLARYKCPDCERTVIIQFEAGKAPLTPKCECGTEMKRQFGKVGLGDVMPEEFVEISRMMTYHSKK